ncbi:MAG: methyltransferase family protein [Aureliella sp.]
MRIRYSWFFLLALTALYLTSSSAWEAQCDAVAESFFVVGLLLAGVGALGRIWCSAYIAGYKNGSLVTEGPYSICRNPLYFFSFVGSIGVGFATETATIPLLVAAAFAIYYPAVIKGEEKFLLSRHGEEYAEYMRRVPRFFPSLRLLAEKEAATVHLVIFRKHQVSAVWFVWLPAFLEGIEYLHHARLFPCYLSIY